ncbi:MAG: diguanylate cyclase [Usitatibacter sp.]
MPRNFGKLLGRAASAVSLLLLIGLSALLVRSQAQGEKELIDRFRIRAEIGSQFLTGYVKDLLARERLEAAAELGGNVSAQQFTRFSRGLGFPAAILLDDAGRVLAVEPPSSEVVGRDFGARYEHLRAALEGQVAVSNVVSSAARSVPVVGFAVPIETDHGRRVFSGALSIATTTLGSSYLKSIVPIANARVYLVDANAATIASSLVGPQTADLMQQRDLPLSKAIASAAEGRYAGSGEVERFAVALVESTPWRLVLSAPEKALLAPLAGPARWISWVIFVVLCIASGTVVLLSKRLASSRAAQLAALEKVSLTDALTGLYNRRGHEILSAQVLRSAAREKTMVAVFFLDLDGLKRVNDEQGHEAGDRLLLRAADFFRSSFRDSDVIARLGGDEFCVVGAVPATAGDGENVRHRLEENLVRHNATRATEPPLAFSIGLAWWDPRNPRSLDDLVKEADGRMYEAKRDKRMP